MAPTVKRFPQNPILYPGMPVAPPEREGDAMGTNLNGPSLIRTPEWLPNRLGEYYLYFGHHQGKYIRLAYANRLEGPWTVYGPGTLRLEETPCKGHIASPDVHVDHAARQIRMYYHGPVDIPTTLAHVFGSTAQKSFGALSTDGIHFTNVTDILGDSYLRVFQYGGWYYSLGMPGFFYRSRDGLTNVENGPRLFTDNMRHSALRLDGDRLHVYYTNARDCPESILHAEIDLRPDWMNWQASEPELVLQPEMDYEGANLPLVASQRGAIHEPARQLRDPCIYQEDGRTYLLYSVAGESGIAMAELL